MFRTQCPQCREDVSLPPTAWAILQRHADAQMRCPQCDEQTPLRRVAMPPMIEIFDGSGQRLAGPDMTSPANHSGSASPDGGLEMLTADAPAGPGGFSPTFDAGIGNGLQIEDDREDDDRDDEDGEWKLREPVGSSMAAAPAVSLQTSPPPRRRETPMWKSLLGVAAGPPIALVAGYFLLAAAGRVPNLGFWPFIEQTPATRRVVTAAPPRNNDVAPVQSPVDSSDQSLANGSLASNSDSAVENQASAVIELSPSGSNDKDAIPSDPDEVAEQSGRDDDPSDQPLPTPASATATTIDDDIERAITLLRSFEGRTKPELRRPIQEAYTLLSQIAGRSPTTDESMMRLIDEINATPKRSYFPLLAAPMMKILLERDDALYLVGNLGEDGRLTFRSGASTDAIDVARLDDTDPSVTGDVMVFGTVQDRDNPSTIRASVIAPFEPAP